jgi:hypothetical protein
MTLHEDWTSNSPRRSKRACIACHTAKIKCDGNERCNRCTKRGIECRYVVQDDPEPAEILLESPPDPDLLEASPVTAIQNPVYDASSGEMSSASHLPSHIPPPTMSVMPAHLRSGGIVDLNKIQIRIASPAGQSIHDIQNKNQDDILFDPNGYLDIYSRHFDYRWPVVHRFSADDQTVGSGPELLISAMKMIGAWIEASDNGKNVAKTLHQSMMQTIIERLVCLFPLLLRPPHEHATPRERSRCTPTYSSKLSSILSLGLWRLFSKSIRQ